MVLLSSVFTSPISRLGQVNECIQADNELDSDSYFLAVYALDVRRK